MLVRMISWNIGGHDVWPHLTDGGLDVALLQEAKVPAAGWPRAVVPQVDAEWRTSGWAEGNWSRRTAVVQVSDRVDIDALPVTTTESFESGAIPVSRAGTLSAAIVRADGQEFTVLSVYAMWERPADAREIYADASAHRLLSDLAALLTTERKHRIIVAGDLNILHGYGEGGNRYWEARYSSVFDRAEAMGLQFVGPQSPDGRQPDPTPDELPQGSLDVPTYHTASQGPMGATRQLDFVFCSPVLADRIRVSALNRTTEDWGPSDHCRVRIDLET